MRVSEQLRGKWKRGRWVRMRATSGKNREWVQIGNYEAFSFSSSSGSEIRGENWLEGIKMRKRTCEWSRMTDTVVHRLLKSLVQGNRSSTTSNDSRNEFVLVEVLAGIEMERVDEPCFFFSSPSVQKFGRSSIERFLDPFLFPPFGLSRFTSRKSVAYETRILQRQG